MVHRHTHWWIVARDTNGKTYLVYGSPNSESDARTSALEMLGGADFKIVPLHHSNIQLASAEWKGGRLKQGAGLAEATKRIGHDRSLRRRIESRRNRRHGR